MDKDVEKEMLQNKSNEQDLKQEETIQENPQTEEVTENKVEIVESSAEIVESSAEIVEESAEIVEESAAIVEESAEIVEDSAEIVEDSESVKVKKPVDKGLDVEELRRKLEEEPELLKKLSIAIASLKEMLSHIKGPYLRDFWDFRHHVVDLFEKDIDIETREKVWSELDQVTNEAKHLKQIEDDQAAFATEQIELAIKSMEDNLETLPEQVKSADDVEFGCRSVVISENIDLYVNVQKELNLLNAYAGRINSLRKELIKTDMRIGRKNKLFKRLSSAGDKIFPRRKELIKDVSTAFISDIKTFVEENFSTDNLGRALFRLRNEVKSLQHVAKVLTLNTHAFTVTRKKLSDCWDKLRESEKLNKKEQQESKERYQPVVDEILEKMDTYKARLEEEQLPVSACHKEINEISKYMRSVELGYEQVKFLRNKMNELYDNLKDREEAEDQERRQQQELVRQQRQDRFNSVKDRIDTLIEKSQELDIEKMKEERDNLQQEIKSPDFNKSEQMQLERALYAIRDLISDKREQALLSLSDDDRNAIEQLKELLQQRLESRNDIRAELDGYKKIKAGSGLDFDKAIMYSEMIDEEQERLKKACNGIKIIKEKIEELKNKA